jgi:mono/diheme cytochrome c family protein
MFKRTLLIAVALVLGGVAVAHAQDAVARGKYLAILGDCAGCHSTGPDSAYSGGLPFTAAFGTVYSPNITPDRTTGIGRWTANQFYHAMHEGVAANGAPLYPAFPFAYFTHVSRADSDAIFAYLKTLKSVRATPPENKLVFPFNIRALMWVWDAMFFEPGAFRADPSKSAQWNRGDYIVNGLGHCAACHTPKNALFGDETSKALTGGTEEYWFSANLRGDTHDGLGKWSVADVVTYLQTGRNKYASAAGSMQEKVEQSTSHMSNADLAAIATYLKSLPPWPEGAPSAPDSYTMQSGQAVFVENCSACHMAPDSHEPRDYPKLAGDTLIMGRDPMTVERIILEGAQSAVTANAKTTFSMPSFAALRDDDIAAVATYIRNSWGNHASPVSRDDVTKLRKALQAANSAVP